LSFVQEETYLMIYLYYTKIIQQLSETEIDLLSHQLPLAIRNKIARFKNWQDAQRCLYGNMLLLEALKDAGIKEYSLSDLKYTAHKRPYFNNEFDFNISHSGEYVVCAFSQECKLGVDIELIADISLPDMKSQFSPSEWVAILSGQNAQRSFYTHWTRKEAFLKAIGLGLSFSPDKVSFIDNTIEWGNTTWYCCEVLLDVEYSCYVVSDKKNIELKLQPVSFAD